MRLTFKEQKTFDSEFAARIFMENLKKQGIQFSYWHASVCQHIVTIK